VVIIFAGLFCVITIFSSYVYFQVIRGQFFTSPEISESMIVFISRERLNATIEFFESRREAFERLRSAKPDSVDPGS
jgi:hypothetical protein